MVARCVGIRARAKMKLRQLRVGDRFILCRTGESYTVVRKAPETPYGFRIVVERMGKESSLHYHCKVRPAGGGT